MTATPHPSTGDRSNRHDPVVVLGEFDGLHRGHRHVIDVAHRVARLGDRPLAGVIFDIDRHRVLDEIDDRVRSLMLAGVARVSVVQVALDPIDAVSIADEIVAGCRPGSIVMACATESVDVTDYPDLRAEFRSRGVDVVEVDRVYDHAGPITSQRVRVAVSTGDLDAAVELTGAPYRITGIVQRGQQLGRTIGFPTANLDPPAHRVIPATGVYAGHVVIDGRRHDAAVNIGVRPTVDESDRLLVEAHLLDLDDDLYDRRITVSLTHRVRDEQRFESLDALTDQLQRDVATVRRLNAG